jgi:translation initiation factor 1
MGEICSTCGLPKELCVCETIAKENQVIEVKVEKKKFGKQYTVVIGIDPKEIDMEDSSLRRKLRSTATSNTPSK